MAIDPNGIQLTPAQRQLVAELAERQDRTPQDVLADLLGPAIVRRRNGARSTPTESAHDLGQRLGLFGALANGPSDLSTNPRYLQGFGRHADRTSAS
jgi:hypothetical protein